MTSPTKPRTQGLYHAAASPPAALAITGGAIGAFYVTAGLLVGAVALWVAIIAGQLVLAAAALLAAWTLTDGDVRRAAGLVGLRRPRPRALLAGALLGVSVWYLGVRVVDLIPWDAAARDRGAALDRTIHDLPIAAAVVALVALPALCEELIFRGILARGLASRGARALAVLVSALLFSAYHLSPLQAVPTLLLGVGLGLLAVRSGSILPGALAHALHNAIVIALDRPEPPAAAVWIDAHGTVALAAALALTGAGLALAWAAGAPPNGGAEGRFT